MATSTSFSPRGEQSIPLHRFPSSASTKYTSSILSNPFSDPDTDTNSIASSRDDVGSINSLLSHPNQDVTAIWRPDRTFRIDSVGKPFFALPTPVSQLEIPIYSTGQSGDDDNHERMVYQSIRPKRQSGSCSLFAAPGARGDQGGVGRELARTTYVWGPGRNPVACIFHSASHSDDSMPEADEFPISKSSLWNRIHAFESKRWGRFEWRYAGSAERKVVQKLRGDGNDINSLLVLEKVSPGKGKEARKVRIAMLIRGDGTRTQGTKSRDAGNGGMLEVCLSGNVGESGSVEGEEERAHMIDEVTVLVTCLVMLKKEVDRARARTIAMMSSGGGGS